MGLCGYCLWAAGSCGAARCARRPSVNAAGRRGASRGGAGAEHLARGVGAGAGHLARSRVGFAPHGRPPLHFGTLPRLPALRAGGASPLSARTPRREPTARPSVSLRPPDATLRPPRSQCSAPFRPPHATVLGPAARPRHILRPPPPRRSRTEGRRAQRAAPPSPAAFTFVAASFPL